MPVTSDASVHAEILRVAQPQRQRIRSIVRAVDSPPPHQAQRLNEQRALSTRPELRKGPDPIRNSGLDDGALEEGFVAFNSCIAERGQVDRSE